MQDDFIWALTARSPGQRAALDRLGMSNENRENSRDREE